MSTPKVSYNVVDKNTHDILVDAILDGGIGYTDKAGEVHQIDAKYGGGGSSLPEVSAADNGDVLTVVSGEWAKAAPSGGGGGGMDFIILGTGSSPTNITASANQGSYADLVAKIPSSPIIGAMDLILTLGGSTGHFTLFPQSVSMSGTDIVISFPANGPFTNGVAATWGSDNSITLEGIS